MPKLLRPNEKITFVQTRAPTPMWRYVKTVALTHASDGTVTRLCTDAMLEFMRGRLWEKYSWVRPKDLTGKSVGATGFQQANLPLSNMDDAGAIIVSAAYLEKLGIAALFDRDKPAYKAALDSGEFSKLVYRAADQLEVSGATFAYSFLFWLSAVKYPPKVAERPVPIVENAGTPLPLAEPAAAAAPRSRAKAN